MIPQPDQDLDRILHALHSAAPRAGMEARIVHHLAQAPARKQRFTFSWPAALALITALLAFFFVAPHSRPKQVQPRQASQRPAENPGHGTAPAAPTSATHQASTSTPPSLRKGTASALAQSVPAGSYNSTPSSPWKGTASAVPSAAYEGAGFSRWGHNSSTPPNQLQATPSRGLADLPSQLAPPAPITAQERRLAQLAQTRDPQTLAPLNPVERELVAQRREAEFKTFFPPPTDQETYLAEHLHN